MCENFAFRSKLNGAELDLQFNYDESGFYWIIAGKTLREIENNVVNQDHFDPAESSKLHVVRSVSTTATDYLAKDNLTIK